MAKHGEKKLYFKFDDLSLAAYFLDFIHKKKFYARVSGSMSHNGQIMFKINGTPDNIKIAIQKLKKLYHKAIAKYDETQDYLKLDEIDEDDELEEIEDESIEERENLKLNLKLKKF